MEIRFKLNPKNEKDQIIIDVLSGEYSPSETIKNILYKMGRNGVEGQRVSSIGYDNGIKVSTGEDSNPTGDNKGISIDKESDDDKCQVMDDEDIMVFFE